MPHFLVHGKRFDVPEKLTIGESRTLKRIAGCSLPQFEHLLAENDPDALAAWLYVVMHRTDPKIELLDIELLDPSMIEYHDDAPAPEVADDPALPPKNGVAAEQSATPGNSETIPEPSGRLLSLTSSDSGQPT